MNAWDCGSHRLLCATALVIGMAIRPATAMAAPILYDEALTGDAPSTAASAVALGALPLGDADVLGSIRAPTATGMDEADYYAFDVALGTQMTAALDVDSFGIGFLNIRLRDPSENMIDQGGFLGDQAVPIWVTASPIGQGSYLMQIDGNNDRKNYRVTFTTVPQAVPEPGTVAVFGLGLAGVAARRRMRRDATQPTGRGKRAFHAKGRASAAQRRAAA